MSQPQHFSSTMCEEGWLACQVPTDMLLVSPGKDMSERRVRLFACNCCRSVWEEMSDDNRVAVEAAEMFADKMLSAAELAIIEADSAIYLDDKEVELTAEDMPSSYWCDIAAWKVTSKNIRIDCSAVCDAARRVVVDRVGRREEIAQSRLLRCITGNPFRTVSFSDSWRTSAVVKLAQSIYDDFSDELFAQLAPALVDVGCNEPQVLDHILGVGPHNKGCWVIDLILEHK